MIIYLIRHAQSLPRPGKPSLGDSIGITKEGRVAAVRLGRWLKRHHVHKIISSPLARAKETAKELAHLSGATLSQDDRAREFLPANIPPPAFKKVREQARRERDFSGEGGESFNTSVKRFMTLIDEVAESDPIAIVSHALLIQNFFLSQGFSKPRLSELSVVTLEKDKNGWHIRAVREAGGLKAIIRSLLTPHSSYT